MKWWVLAAAVILWASVFMVAPAKAHDKYKEWKSWDGGSCCSERVEHPSGDVTGDCRPVRATQDMDGNWIAYERGKEYRIPPQAIRPIQSPDGRSHLCEMHNHIFCFVPGEVRS